MSEGGGNMTINEIINAIGSCGFPIFACVYLVKSFSKQIEELTQVINRNTNVIEKLSTKEREKK